MTTRSKATGKSERLAVLNNSGQEALYGFPDFDDAQQLGPLLTERLDDTIRAGWLRYLLAI